MEKQKNVVFGTALNGYRKQDVNAFIASLNASFNEAKEGYVREIASLKDELGTLREVAAAYEGEKAELAQLWETVRKADAMAAELEAMRVELAACKAAPEPADPPVSPEELAELRKKAALYERMSSQLGDIMISANHQADLMMEDTRRAADQSLTDARTTIAQSAALLAGQLDSLYRGANSRALNELGSAMQQTQRSLNRFIEEIATCRTRFEENVRQTDLETRRAAEEHITRMAECAQDAISAIGAKPAEDPAE